MPLQQTTSWNHCGKRRYCSWWAISPFAATFSTLFNNWTLIYWDFLMFLSRCFQSRLLQICCVWERVKMSFQAMIEIISKFKNTCTPVTNLSNPQVRFQRESPYYVIWVVFLQHPHKFNQSLVNLTYEEKPSAKIFWKHCWKRINCLLLVLLFILKPQQKTTFENIIWEKEKLLMMFTTLFNYFTFIFLLTCFQICLLQIWCMWERVNTFNAEF